jgi:hypothetical protein
MSGVKRLEVAEITKSGAKGKELIGKLGSMDSVVPPGIKTKAAQNTKDKKKK